MKTGFTNGANRCLVTSVKRNDMDIISVVLGADTKKDRTKDSIKIIEYAFANYQMVDMEYMIHDEFDELVQNSRFFVDKGITNEVKLDLDEVQIGNYPVRNDNIKDIKVRSRA